jgi:hypothetical protein
VCTGRLGQVKLICLDVADLRRLDLVTGGGISERIRDVVRRGFEPEVVVRREPAGDRGFTRWFVRVAGSSAEGPLANAVSAEFEVTDIPTIAALAGLYLGDLRAEIHEELRVRLDRERERGRS